MKYDAEIAQGLIDEILSVVYEYSESMLTATAVGCLEVAKMQILADQINEIEDDE
jgi:hypothetical protein